MSEGPVKWAFALVHGIGTTKPMDLIGEVTTAMNVKSSRVLGVDGPAVRTDEPAEAHTAPAELRSRSATTNAPKRRQFAQGGTFYGERARFAAMEWSDISFYKDGVINMIGGLLLTSFGVRYFAEAAGSRDRWLARLLHVVLKTVVLLIALFAFPFTLVSLIYSGTGILAENLLRGPALVPWQTTMIVLISVAICAGIATIGWRSSQPLKEERPLAVPIFVCIIVYAVLLALLFLAGHVDRYGHWHLSMPKGDDVGFVSNWIRQTLVWTGDLVGHRFWVSRVQTLDEIGLFFGLMHWLQLAVGLVMLVLVIFGLLLGALDDLIGRIRHGSGRSMVFAAVSVTSIWIVNLIIMWPENLVTATAMITYSKGVKAEQQKAIGCGTRSDWLEDSRCLRISVYDQQMRWFIPQPAYSDDVPTVNKSGGPVLPPYNINAYYPLMWFEAAFIAFLALVALAAFVLIGSRWFWFRRFAGAWRRVPKGTPATTTSDAMGFMVVKPAKVPKVRNKPRLIVSDLYISAVVVLIAACAAIMFAPLVRLDQPLLRVLAWIVTYGGDNTQFHVPHEISVPFTWVKMGVIFSVAVFVLGATYIRDMTKLGLDVVNHFTRTNDEYPVRERIARRFDETLNLLLRPTTPEAAMGPRPHLVIISHSQGTVITFDALRDRLRKELDDGKVASITVLTFGSPLSHVYQHYFSSTYEPLDEIAAIRELAKDDKRVRWFNIYRVDDYVGTYITNSIDNFPINVPMPPGGHIDYWNQDVFERLFKVKEMHDWVTELQSRGGQVETIRAVNNLTRAVQRPST